MEAGSGPGGDEEEVTKHTTIPQLISWAAYTRALVLQASVWFPTWLGLSGEVADPEDVEPPAAVKAVWHTF